MKQFIISRRQVVALVAAAIALTACQETADVFGPGDGIEPAFAKGGTGGVKGGGAASAERIVYPAYNPSTFTWFLAGVNADGTEPTAIPGTDHAMHAAWSPDRRTIAVATTGMHPYPGLYVMNADGSGQKLIYAFSQIMYPRFSPSGKQIAFLSEVNSGQYSIMVIGTNGKNLRQLTAPSAFEDIRPTWSPDGRRIAFMSSRTGSWEIYTMNADGTNQTRVSSCQELGIFCRNAAWSPVDERIAFSYTSGTGFAIGIMSSTGALLDGFAHSMDHGAELEPAWSPDGSRLAFASRMAGTTQPELFVVSATGGNPQRITFTPAVAEGMPAWAR